MPYVYQAYPKTLYHADGSQRTVANLSEQNALGSAWSETPASVGRGVYSVASATSSQVLAAANPLRTFMSIYNHSTASLYVKLGAGASDTDFSFPLGAGKYFEMPLSKEGRPYNGLVTGAWATANGSAKVTEFSS